MTLAVRIEEATGVRIGVREIARISTVRDLLELVSSRPSLSPAEMAKMRAKDLEKSRWWITPRNWGQRAVGAVVYAVLRGLMRWIYGLNVEGAGRLPSSGALLICPNHASDLDIAAVAAALPAAVRSRLTWAADAVRVFQVPIYRIFCRSLRVFPVDQRTPLVAVDLAAEVLQRGDALVWFPEGWRSADGKLLRFQEGVGRVMKTAGPLLVVPAFIGGVHEIWPRNRRFPRFSGRVRIAFGEPIAPQDLAPSGDLDTATPDEIAAALRLRVAGLAHARGADIL